MILHITRKFPPSVGGMQNVNYELYKYWSSVIEIKLIAWGREQIWLPFYIIKFLILAPFELMRNKGIRIIFLGDALLLPLGLMLRLFFKKAVVVMAHGLDVTWRFRPYQWMVTTFLKKADLIICVSSKTREECIVRGAREDKIAVIPNGVEIRKTESSVNKRDTVISRLKDEYHFDVKDKKLIISVGRLVERKGFHHFIENVLPDLFQRHSDVKYVIAGQGPYREKIASIIKEKKLSENICLLGSIPQDLLSDLFSAADIFVMPNIPVSGDMEGFGIVALEACAAGLPVIASRLDGIPDAVQHESNGVLVDWDKESDFVNRIDYWLNHEDERRSFAGKAREYVEEHYAWPKIGQAYLDQFKMIKLN